MVELKRYSLLYRYIALLMCLFSSSKQQEGDGVASCWVTFLKTCRLIDQVSYFPSIRSHEESEDVLGLFCKYTHVQYPGECMSSLE